MDNIYILHGCCDKEEFFSDEYQSMSNSHWIPWLQKELIMKGYNVQTPEMPFPYKANYEDWKSIFQSFPLNEDTTLIGHSCGCGFFLKYLSETLQPIKRLVLVAPWLDPDKILGEFLTCKLNPKLSELIDDIHVFYAHNEDVTGVKPTVDLVMESYPKAKLHEFETHGHFCLGDMGTPAFPELLEVVEHG